MSKGTRWSEDSCRAGRSGAVFCQAAVSAYRTVKAYFNFAWEPKAGPRGNLTT
ncbi:MAG TPA: hypothetical protein VM597_41440 [Gemmataceae bacterium]|nr:hypothetical protein [Gemmataceae bacterium]